MHHSLDTIYVKHRRRTVAVGRLDRTGRKNHQGSIAVSKAAELTVRQERKIYAVNFLHAEIHKV